MLRTLQLMTNLQHLSEGWAPTYPAVDGDRIPGSTQQFNFLHLEKTHAIPH